MLLIEEKSLDEVSELYILSNLKTNYPYMTVAILETKSRIFILKTMKELRKTMNKIYIENPYNFPITPHLDIYK